MCKIVFILKFVIQVISKKRDEDSSSDAPESSGGEEVGSASTRITHLPTVLTMQSPLSPSGNFSDSNESNDSVFDDSLCGPQIVRPVVIQR